MIDARISWWPAGRLLLMAVLAAIVSGCTLPGGGRVTLFPETAALLPEARDLRYQVPAEVPRELERRVLPTYIIEPGDLLLIQPANLDSPVRFPGDQKVLADGTIDLGRFGRVPVAGMTLDQVAVAVNGLVHGPEPTAGPVLVRLIASVNQVFYVVGEVNAPGVFPLTGRETVLDGILAAGGLNDRASRTDIILSRPTHPGEPHCVLPVCFNQIVQLGDTTTNYQLAPGDRIFVPSRSYWENLLGSHHGNGPCEVGKHTGACKSGAPTPTGP